MIPQAIRMAEGAFRRYKTRNPYEIIEARNILLKEFIAPQSLLGFYTVMNRRQIIGINKNTDNVQKTTGLIHEIGHSLNDYRLASSGNRFDDDFWFFSMSDAPCEYNANLAGADLFIPDEFILQRIAYDDYVHLIKYIDKHIDNYRSDRAKMRFEEEKMQEFYYDHPELPSYEQLAAELGVDVGIVKFKFKALNCKDYDLPNIPETRSDFLRNWKRN